MLLKLNQVAFIKELMEANGVSVPIKNSRIAADTYEIVCAEWDLLQRVEPVINVQK